MRSIAAVFVGTLCSASEVPLATFDGAKGSTHKWGSHDDPVMGGKSKSTTHVEDGVLVFDGTCAIVPFLQAPGFITTATEDSKPFADISSCSAIRLTLKSEEAYKGYRISFGTAHAPGGKRHAYGYKANFDAPVGKFDDVVIPLTSFTDDWNDATGDPVVTCRENKTFCPNHKTLQNMETISVWAEGVEGKVHLEIKYIGGTDCGKGKEFGTPLSNPPPVVKELDVAAYLGLWYQIADYPEPYECIGGLCFCGACTRAQYGAGANGTLTVKNTCKATAKVPISIPASGCAVQDPASPAKLTVGFGKNCEKRSGGTNYWVMRVGPKVDGKYSFALVGDGQRHSCYILNREPTMNQTTYAEQLDWLTKVAGYDVSPSSKWRLTPQEGCKY